MSPRVLYLLSAEHALVDARDRRDARVVAGRMPHLRRDLAHAHAAA